MALKACMNFGKFVYGFYEEFEIKAEIRCRDYTCVGVRNRCFLSLKMRGMQNDLCCKTQTHRKGCF